MKKYIKKKIKSAVVNTAYFSGLANLFGTMHGQKIFCIGYHSISDPTNKEKLQNDLYHNISIDKDNFEEQLIFMKKNGHTFLTFKDLRSKDIGKLKKPTLVFFDDGFKDVYLNALPVLEKLKIPATIFITTGLIEQTDILWTIKVRSILKKEGLNKKTIEEKILEFKKFDKKRREEEIGKKFESFNPKDLSIFLEWQEIEKLKNHGFEVGSHGLRHEKFSELNENELIVELRDSKKILESKFGEITTVSYPYGRANATVEKLSFEAGYSFGLGVNHGFNKLEDILKSPYNLKRITPEPEDSLNRFATKLYMNI